MTCLKIIFYGYSLLCTVVLSYSTSGTELGISQEETFQMASNDLVTDAAAANTHTQATEVLEKVQEFIKTNDWGALKEGLGAVLDHSSEEYKQLQDVYSICDVGYLGKIQLASLLLRAGLPPDQRDSGGLVMLHAAAYRGRLQLVNMLLDLGADVNVKDGYNSTPLTAAAERGHIDVVKRLVQAGADITVRTELGITAEDYARTNGETAVAEYLQQLPH